MGRIEDGIAEIERAADALDALPDGPEQEKPLAAYAERTRKFGVWLQECPDSEYEAACARLGHPTVESAGEDPSAVFRQAERLMEG